MERFMDDIDRFKQKKILGTCFRFWGDIVRDMTDTETSEQVPDIDNVRIFTMKTDNSREPIPPLKESRQKNI